MSEPDITALARRLAEQNNVDWRGLHGSGDGGRIVERDVLDYLARVMAGEEALDPTPEPLPDGMEAWPDQDPELRQAGQATTLGELRHEIGSAVRDDPSGPLAGVHESQEPVAEVDEDVFLFDDEPTHEVTAPADTAPPAGDAVGTVQGGDDLEDLLVAGDDAGLLSDEDDISVEPGAYGAEAAQADADAFTADVAGDADDLSGDQWGEGIALGGSDHAQAGDAPDIWGEPVVAAEDETDLFGETVSASADVDVWSHEEVEPDRVEEVAGDAVVGEWVADAGSEEPAVEPVAEPWQRAGEAEAAEVATPAWSPGSATDGGLAVDEQEEHGDLAAIPLARTGTVLRRHVDVTALAGAQLAVSQELGFEEPLGAGPFVLRAVAKAAREQGGDVGQVALATFDGGFMLRRVDDAAVRAFSELVNELAGSGQEEDEAGLVVADLSGLDVDEVVLDVDLPVVSLGRMLYDNQRGGYRSTLTLTGDLPAEQGARLLSRVAELLDAPVRLMM